LQGLRCWIVPGGACSFTAKANNKGANAHAADILYRESLDTLKELGEQGIDKIYANTAWMKDHNFAFYGDLEGHKRHRKSALSDFVADYDKKRYTYAKFPHLRFAANSFDLCLSGHFLFTYDDRFDYDFHLASIMSMIEIASEVRIFPLVDMNNSKQGKERNFSPFVYRLLDELPSFELKAQIVPVDFEFQRGAGFMMRICKK
jgi:hypothetical protein